METPRIRLNSDPKEQPNSLEAVAHFLESQKFDVEKEYFHFEIDPALHPITAEAVQSLLSLSFEVALTEANGHVIVETGKEHSADGGPGFLERRDHSRLSMHTHPLPKKEGELPVNTPSFSDVYISEFASKSTPLLLATPSGLMHYRKPVFNPLTKQPFTGEARDMMLGYSKHHGVDVFGFDTSGKLKRYWDLPEEEKVRFQRQFAEETGMIVAEALWGDSEGLKKLLEIINLREQK